MNNKKIQKVKLLLSSYRSIATKIAKAHFSSLFSTNDFVVETNNQLIKRNLKVVKNTKTKWLKTCNFCITSNPYRRFSFQSKFDKNLKLNLQSSSSLEDKSKLSARYIQTISYQVVGILDSYLENRKNDFVKIAYSRFSKSDFIIKLLYINKYNLWFNNEIYMNGCLIEKEVVMIARKIIKHLFKVNSFPKFNNINMALDSKVAVIKSKKNDKAKSFDYWISLSSLEKGKTIKIPISTNKYFNSKVGALKNFCQINLVDGDIKISFLKNLESKKDSYIPKVDKIGLDFGLKTLFTTSLGGYYNQNFMTKIQKYDDKITKLAKSRQKQGLKTSSKRYKKLVSKLRNFLKNEIGRSINSIVSNHSPKEIVIEKLDFRSPKLSKRMNRLISNYGKKVINSKFEDIKQTYGIITTEVRAEYSSSGCNSCGYVDKRSRKTQDKFECLFCENKANADYNASLNIKERSSLPLFSMNSFVKRKELLHKLNKEFIETKLTLLYENTLRTGNHSNARILIDKIKKNKYLEGDIYFNDLLMRFESVCS